MGKAQSQLDNIKDWDLSGGGGFTLSALEFSQDIQAQLNEVKRILAASEAKREDTPLVDTPLVDTPLVDTLRNEVIIEKEVNVTSKINHREEKELVSETPNQRMEDKEEVSDTSSYHYYNAFPQEAKQYPTLIVSKLTATPQYVRISIIRAVQSCISIIIRTNGRLSQNQREQVFLVMPSFTLSLSCS